MAVVTGLMPSFRHVENGMIEKDMRATLRVAQDLNEVIVFRSTGPWSKRWIADRFPTKNFHVKGKSSDWGPQAGFVPHLGKYSKVGASEEAANKGTFMNNLGTQEGFTRPKQLMLSLKQINTQLTQPEETPARRALIEKVSVPGQPQNYFLKAERTGDRKIFWFLAKWNSNGKYGIFVFDETQTVGASPTRLANMPSVPLDVMVSLEAGANEQPMTGDYDLMMVCPTWGNYMARTLVAVSKDRLDFGSGEKKAHKTSGITFEAGSFLDRVLDMRVSTGAQFHKKIVGYDAKGNAKKRIFTHQNTTVDEHNHILAAAAGVGDIPVVDTGLKIEEHTDMGNLTPRILRCINRLNAAMEYGSTAMRRVHHNAESHRHAMFGALVYEDMAGAKQDGFPMTGFHPRELEGKPGWPYGDVVTLENMTEFMEYMDKLNEFGYQVPRNSAWQVSIRNRPNGTHPRR